MKTFIISLTLIVLSCTANKRIEEYKAEIMKAENAFAQMARDVGFKEAFLAFAADSAVLYRNNKILKGEDTFKDYFSKPVWKDAKLSWQPDFIDVSESGDLAYTYGSYTFTSTDSTGEIRESTGIFHTVWKRQKDDSWKFVWD